MLKPYVSSPYLLIHYQSVHHPSRTFSYGIYIQHEDGVANVVITEPFNYEEMSITNTIEYIARDAWERFNLSQFGRVIWYEYYSDKLEWKARESISAVRFDWNGGVPLNPSWNHMARNSSPLEIPLMKVK